MADAAAGEAGEAGAEVKAKTPVRRGTLLIVESPAKAKTIQKYLGSGYDGHRLEGARQGPAQARRRRRRRRLQGDLRGHRRKGQGRGPRRHPRQGQARRARAARHRPRPRGRGDRLALHGRDQGRASPTSKCAACSSTRSPRRASTTGINSPRDLDPHLYEAQRTRRVLDRIGGYPLSNLLWRKLAFGLSAGRVQTPALRIIVDRQHEIDAFIPRPYWILEAQLNGNLPPQFTRDPRRRRRREAREGLVAACGDERARREALRAGPAHRQLQRLEDRYGASAVARAPSPYTTSKLQQDASNRLGMKPKRAMRVAQGLYEGVPVGKGEEEEVVGLDHVHAYRQPAPLRRGRAGVPRVHRQDLRREGAARAAQRLQEQEAERAGRARSGTPDAHGPAARRGAAATSTTSATACTR